MKFLVDAQLPRRFCAWLSAAGHDALHTLDLPAGNRTCDRDIVALADRDGRVVVTKDDDFVQSHLVSGQPRRLLLIATGNIANIQLESLIRNTLPNLVNSLEESHFVELGRENIILHD